MEILVQLLPVVISENLRPVEEIPPNLRPVEEIPPNLRPVEEIFDLFFEN
jgi:hypothetical protein